MWQSDGKLNLYRFIPVHQGTMNNDFVTYALEAVRRSREFISSFFEPVKPEIASIARCRTRNRRIVLSNDHSHARNWLA